MGYENGGFGYHTTMPTDALRDFHQITVETMQFGLPELKQAQIDLGIKTHQMYKTKTQGIQIAMGVPWRIDEPVVPMKTFRMGLFGLDKLGNIQETVDVLEESLDKVLEECESDNVQAA